MNLTLFLLCKYNGVTLPIKYFDGLRFKELFNKLHAKWNCFRVGFVLLCYSLPGHPFCVLDNDEHLDVMVALAVSCGIDRVEIDIRDIGSMSVADSGSDMSCCTSNSNVSMIGLKECRADSEKQVCVVPSFVPDENIVLLSTGWENSIREVGQKFVNGVVEFRDVLCKYSIACGFEFYYEKNDKERVTAYCKQRVICGCLWSIHGRVDKSNKCFYIRKLNNEHTCGTVFRTTNNSRASSSIIGSLIASDMQSKPLKPPIDVVSDINRNYGLTITYRRAWLGVEKARGNVFGNYGLSYNNLRWYVDACKDANPGSCIEMEFNPVSRNFVRLFVAFHACIQGFNFCRPVLFLDATFLKGKYRGSMLAASAKDGNEGMKLFSILCPVCFC